MADPHPRTQVLKNQQIEDFSEIGSLRKLGIFTHVLKIFGENLAMNIENLEPDEYTEVSACEFKKCIFKNNEK